jgi:hypothetical protein
MSTTSLPAAPPKAGGRPLLWLGLLAVVAWVPLGFLQMLAGILLPSWLGPALASVGTALVVLSLWRRLTAWRILALLVAGVITAGQWWLVLSYARLPSDTGRVVAQHEMPEFTAYRADRTPFTQNDLKGDKETVLVSFRGRW